MFRMILMLFFYLSVGCVFGQQDTKGNKSYAELSAQGQADVPPTKASEESAIAIPPVTDKPTVSPPVRSVDRSILA